MGIVGPGAGLRQHITTMERAERSVFRIKVGQGQRVRYGTGSLVSIKGFNGLLTCKDVVRDLGELLARNFTSIHCSLTSLSG